MDIGEFLLARIAEDEAVAVRDCNEVHPEADVYHRDGHPDPKRLAECEAKRHVVGFLQGMDGDPVHGMAVTEALRVLALPHADHPDYDERWRP